MYFSMVNKETETELKQESTTYGTEREGEVNKIFIKSLLCAWQVQDFDSWGKASNFWSTSKAKRVNWKSFFSR